MWKIRSFLNQKVDGNMILIDYWNVLVLNFSEMGNTVFFETKNENIIFTDWLLKCSCFELFGDGKYGLFLRQKVDAKMIFTGYWKVFVLSFSVMGNTVFLRQKGNGKVIFTDYWKVLVLGYQKVLDLSFLVMGNKVFFSQKVDIKVIFTCSFLAFHDIPGPGKYGFLCSVSLN